MKFFNLDSPLMSFLSKVADLIMLNIVFMICCIPVFTIGASWTALHYMTIKMVKNEEGYIIRGFFKSFRENFRQATLIWLMMLVVIGLLIGDFIIMRFTTLSFPQFIQIAVIVIFFIFLIGAIYVFPVLSRFENTIKNTIKNAYIMSILNLPRTILILIIYALPLALCYFVTPAIPVAFLMGYAASAYGAAFFYSRIFSKYEPEEEEKEEEGLFELPDVESELFHPIEEQMSADDAGTESTETVTLHDQEKK